MGFLSIEAEKIGRLAGATQFDMISTDGRRVAVDRLMRFENLEEDWRKLTNELDLEAPLPHWNWIEHPARQEFYSNREAAWVERYWARDIETFDYSFDD